MADFSSTSSEETVKEYYRLQSENYHRKYYGDDPDTDDGIKVELLQNTFRDRNVLEIACGTGFWTEIVAETARSILATDANISMIAKAQERLMHLPNAAFAVTNAYTLDVAENFTGAFSVLFWCHIPRQHIGKFLKILCTKLVPGSPVVIIDQLEDSDVSTHSRDKYGNMLAKRKISGKEFHVVKNIPEHQQLLDDFREFADNINYKIHPGGYWSVHWVTK